MEGNEYMKALIIGGAGFVGNYLARFLKDNLEWDVTITKLSKGKIEEETHEVKCCDLDVLDAERVKKVLTEISPDYIFHLAALSSVRASWDYPGLTVDVNIKGVINVLEGIRCLPYSPKILLVGSGEEYGYVRPEEVPICEDNTLRPGNIYAASKAAQNMIGKIYADAYAMNIIMVRAFNHFGPGQSPIFVVSDFCKQVAQIEKGMQEPTLYVGNLDAKRDFTDVRDVVKAYAKLINDGVSGQVYNVGSGKAISIEALLNIILSLSTKEIKVVIDQEKIRPVDVPIIQADVTKIYKDTGWYAENDVVATIEDTLNYWRKKIIRVEL